MSLLVDLIEECKLIHGSYSNVARAIGTTAQHLNGWRHERTPCPVRFVAAMAELTGKEKALTVGLIALEQAGKRMKAPIAGAVVTLFTLLTPGGDARAAAANADNV